MVEFLLANSPVTGQFKTIGGSNQQIIVIPQSLLNSVATSVNTSGKIVVTTANSQGGSQVITNNRKPTVKVAPSIVMKPEEPPKPLTKIGLKRPLPQDSPDLTEDDDCDSTPGRKRANLDHLTPEEKMMRRKLKNRVAAQNARDKKRAKMEDMEDMIKKFEEEKQKLRTENEQLQKINARLMSENHNLKREVRSSSTNSSDYLLPPSPDSMPPMSPGMINNDQTIVVPRPSEPAELTNELLPKGQGLGTAVGQDEDKSVAAMSAAACLFWTCLVTSFLANKNINNLSREQEDSSSNNTNSNLKTNLPLKKRNTNTAWWGPHQGSSWSPTMKT